MTAKEYLSQYKDATKIIERVRAEYEEQMEQVDSIRSALGGDGLPRSGEVSKRVETDAVRLAEKAEELIEAEVDALEIRQEIVRLLRHIDQTPQDVLWDRYVNLRKWEDVADNIGYSLRRTFELHREGLDAVDKIINK